MAISLKNYLENVALSLESTFCLRNFPSQLVEKHNKPEIELMTWEKEQAVKRKEARKKIEEQNQHLRTKIPMLEELTEKNSKKNYLVLNPVMIARTAQEYFFIEPSINSVRVSFVFKKPAPLDKLVVSKISSFFQKRAETLFIVRKKPIDGYDLTFLITNFHLEKFDKKRLIDWIIDFVDSIAKDINEIKLNLNTQSRIAATFFVKMMATVDVK